MTPVRGRSGHKSLAPTQCEGWVGRGGMGDGTNVFIWLVSRVIGNHHLALREPAAAGTLNRLPGGLAVQEARTRLLEGRSSARASRFWHRDGRKAALPLGTRCVCPLPSPRLSPSAAQLIGVHVLE